MQFTRSLLAAGVLMAAGNVHAYMAEFQFTATVTAGPLAPVGTQFTGYFSYETTSSPWVGSTAAGDFAIYSLPAPARMVATVNGHALSAAGLSVSIFDNAGGGTQDLFDMSGSAPTVDGQVLANGSFGLRLSATSNGQALVNAALPVQFDIAAFDTNVSQTYGWLLADGGQEGHRLSFSIDSITAVPVPAAAWLFGSGLFGLAAAARRRKV